MQGPLLTRRTIQESISTSLLLDTFLNVLVIPALSVLLLLGSLVSNRALVYREAQFSIVAIATLLLTFSLAVIYFPSDEGDVQRGHPHARPVPGRSLRYLPVHPVPGASGAPLKVRPSVGERLEAVGTARNRADADPRQRRAPRHDGRRPWRPL